ncbi:hypothetical protein ACIQMV_30370 [Streptomyces sp. NPDC091412]|uniref:hypothetical protein n=1 Tax=unclassified Streptomyces TaxID=2593676 RepID=UPI0011420442|nr:hypothetical protein [Streptomyces sp. 6-11-2]GED89011.1 hypothetical protein TNCT6_60960 [Streptomyces sp. 6-11-2]
MRHTQPPSPSLSPSAAVAATAAVLALGLAAGPADAAGTGISVSANGSTVSVTTSVCSQVNGRWGTASLLTAGQTNFTQGRQVALTGMTGGQSAAWQSVSPGTYTVAVVCANNIMAGTQSIVVTGGRATATAAPTFRQTKAPNVVPTYAPNVGPYAPNVGPYAPNIAPTVVPTRGVLGGVGGGVKDYGPLTLAVGGTLVGAAVVATGWVLRRRSKPSRF